MTKAQAGHVAATAERIATRAAEFMVRYPDASVDECIWAAFLEDALLYGCQRAGALEGVIGHSPIASVTQRLGLN